MPFTPAQNSLTAVKLSLHHCKDPVLSPQTHGNSNSLLVTNQQSCNNSSIIACSGASLDQLLNLNLEFQTYSGKVLIPQNFVSDARIQKVVMETKPLSIFQHKAPPCSLKYSVIYLGKNFAMIVHMKKVTVSFSSKELWIVPLSYQSRIQGESFQTLKDFTKIHNWGQNPVSISCLRGLKPPGCKFSDRSNHFMKPNIPATWFHFSHCSYRQKFLFYWLSNFLNLGMLSFWKNSGKVFQQELQLIYKEHSLSLWKKKKFF